MVEEILDYIHNYFEYRKVKGAFSISSGVLEADFIAENQYIRIVGSIFNDGVWKYPTDTLTDETFTGEVWLLAIPPAVTNTVAEIEAWMEANKDAVESPYTSESFGGYSYSKGGTENGAKSDPGWKSIFGSKLNRWRKLA